MMKRNLLLLLGVIALTAVPLLIHYSRTGQPPFSATEEQAEDAIAASGYEPSNSGLWESFGPEIESMLFAVQAAIGAGLVGYCIGFYRGRHIQRKESSHDATG